MLRQFLKFSVYSLIIVIKTSKKLNIVSKLEIYLTKLIVKLYDVKFALKCL